MRFIPVALFAFWFFAAEAVAEVKIIGEMRRMFTARDIAPNVDLAEVSRNPHLFALGPLAGLAGEVTVLDGEVFVSKVNGSEPSVAVEPRGKSVFLVYDSVSDWRPVDLPKSVRTEQDLAGFLEQRLPKNTRSAFLIRGTVKTARYHIQNFKGKAAELTHEAHDRAKILFELADTPVELVGFFTNRDEDGGLFVHKGQTTHVHLVSTDRKHAGHLESMQLAPGAKLLLPALPVNPLGR